MLYNKEKVGTMARHNIVLWTVDTERMSPAALGQRKPAGTGPDGGSLLPSTAARTETAQRLLRLRGACAARANAIEAERGVADTSAQATGTRASATAEGRRAATACRRADPWRGAWSEESEIAIEVEDDDDDRVDGQAEVLDFEREKRRRIPEAGTRTSSLSSSESSSLTLLLSWNKTE
jgi:hypothetical protein